MPELKIKQRPETVSRELSKPDKKYTVNCYLLTALIPAAVLLFFYLIKGIAPFGDNSLCSMDGFSQYYPMLENLSRAVKEGELFYSFSGSLGYNLWAQTAYYTNSPLWLIVYLLPQRFHVSAIDLIVLARFSLAALTFCIRLNARSAVTRPKLLHYAALSSAYALSSYMIAFINQFMWADAVVLLPLVVLGLERMLEKKKPALYIVSLALTIWSCFYLGYMVCLFAVLYQLYLLVSREMSMKSRITGTLRFALYSLISGGLCAVTLIPVFLSISQTKASSIGFGGIKFYNNLLPIIRNFLPFSEISLEYGAPNLFCGVVTLVLAFALLFYKSVPLRKRIAALLMVVFMLLSFELNILTYVWHGFHFPNQLPGRHSFLLIFFLVAAAAEFFNVIDRPLPAESPSKAKRFGGGCAAAFLSVLLLFEMTTGAIFQLGTQTWISKYSSLNRDADTAQAVAALNPGKDDFFRAEFTSSKKNNSGLQYGYNGIAYYSSTMSGAAYDFFQNLGMPRYAKNVSTHYEHSEILDALFAVKYIIEEDGKTITENKNRLSLAFKADEAVLDFDIAADKGVILQQKLWDAVCGADNLSVEEGIRRLSASQMSITDFSASRIEGVISCDSSGVLFTSIPDDGGWRVYIDGERVPTVRLCSYLCGAQIQQGEHEILLKYTPPGFAIGLTLSLLSLAAAVILLIFNKSKQKKEM